MQLYTHSLVRPEAKALVSQNTLQVGSGFHCRFLLLAWWVFSTVAMQSVLRPQCWASEVPRSQKVLVLTQVEAWNSFMFMYISYMHSLKTARCKRCANSFTASGRLSVVYFVCTCGMMLTLREFQILEELCIWTFFVLFYPCYLSFTCLIFFQFLGIIGKGVTTTV